ncbi:hypothetical protein VC159_04975 [Polynucleobacter sp. JS-JIR-II-c23]|uniref:hypothetical protein n=1 Tax=Polynucleobacter sp. JS-JIR-II-c23 TaxID=1758393 RepID=UPI002B22427D|nr:hypothetical protein [Polynucleobacter sp. JS-JIR-II-c23]MEA9603804.1 hypothetical protein [Polynucleobacter sp. JS-JIR-II-c23]
MVIFHNLIVSSIGCSCINQFQIEDFFLNNPDSYIEKGVFDYIIISPQSTIDLFKSINRYQQVFEDINNYEILKKKLFHKHFECLYFWHEKYIFNEFDLKKTILNIKKKIANINPVPGMNHLLIWSNIQPNLKIMMEGIGQDYNNFILTEQLYRSLKEQTKLLYGENSRLIFISREQDVQGGLVSNSDVHIIELERSLDFRGEKKLFFNIINSYINQKS